MMKQCKICGSKTSSFIIVKSGKLYHKCNYCDFISLDDNFIVNKEKEKERYNLHENTIENEGYVKYLKNFINFAITPYQNNIKTILDFGCGPEPVLATLLKAEGYEVNYYDLYFYNNDYKNKVYDMIVSTEVIEHTKNPLETLDILLSILKENSFLSIMTLFSPNSKKEFTKWWYKDDITHISFFTEKTFKVISKKLNCSIEKSNNKNIIILKKTKP